MNAAASPSNRAIAVERSAQPDDPVVAGRSIRLHGHIQGVGARPAIARLAESLRLTGFVSNTSSGVMIYVEGRESQLRLFVSELPAVLPTAAILRGKVERTVEPLGYHAFEIRASDETGSVAADVPKDLAICDDCRRELLDPDDRRFRYAFGSCTNCGPRYSVIQSMPWERATTSMAEFGLCDDCAAEFVSSDDRRFHAQTIACGNCGPQVWLQSGQEISRWIGYDAIMKATEVIRSGGILAMKGLGGYQLVCDAANANAVELLRQRKQRLSKPLAVMVISCDAIQATMTPAEVTAISSSANPIVVLDNVAPNWLAPGISPALNGVGIFLPSTPLHALLIKAIGRPMVVTSGNSDGDPLAFEDHGGDSLRVLADAVLHHDRRIERPIDDSVIRVMSERTVTIRSGRGIAPVRLAIETTEKILAVGGDQKVAVAISNGRQSVLGPHIGDMRSLAVRERFIDNVKSMQQLYGIQPEVIVHDLHPDFFTTLWAARQPCRTIGVQHHHAHVVAGMIEHGMLDQEVLGVALDGTGYGTDGTIWGGEFLLATPREFRRIASLRPFVLPGGDAAIREPWRVAVSLLVDAVAELSAQQIAELLAQPDDRVCLQLAEGLIREKQFGKTASVFGPMTSSMGRLFDGVAVLVLGQNKAEYEGQLAMQLEAACDSGSMFASEDEGFELTRSNGIMSINWGPVVRRIAMNLSHIRIRGKANSKPECFIATCFHEAVARMVATVAGQFPNYPVVLSGGCFQNRVLTEMTEQLLCDQNRIVAPPGSIPPNDGGLAAGQLAIAAALLDAEQRQLHKNDGRR